MPGPPFVDHHAHLLRVAAGASDLGSGEPIAGYHRRIVAKGSTPMDEPPGEPATGNLMGALRSGLQRAVITGLSALPNRA